MTVRLPVKVNPGAAQSRIMGWLGGSLKIRVQAPPEKGKANAAVVALLARGLAIPAGSLNVVSGQTARNKIVEIAGLDEAEVTSRLNAYLSSGQPE